MVGFGVRASDVISLLAVVSVKPCASFSVGLICRSSLGSVGPGSFRGGLDPLSFPLLVIFSAFLVFGSSSLEVHQLIPSMG